MRVYADEDDEYFTYITPEAYNALEEWAGEHVTKDSWLMRNLWDCRGVEGGTAMKPSKLGLDGIRGLIHNALRYQGVHSKLENGKRGHEFRTNNGFRKFFKTHTEQVMKPIHVEMLIPQASVILTTDLPREIC